MGEEAPKAFVGATVLIELKKMCISNYV